jgi:hypothetical protein
MDINKLIEEMTDEQLIRLQERILDAIEAKRINRELARDRDEKEEREVRSENEK